MRTTCILAGLALVACGGDSSGDGGGDTGAQANRFAEFIFVDQEGFEATGDFTGLPEGDDWDSVAWLTQQVDPANVRDNMVSGEVEDFQDEIPVPQARVELWFDDVVDSTIDGEATSAVDGTIGMPARSCQMMAYRVTTDPDLNPTKTTYKAHHTYAAEADDTVEGGLFISVSDTTYRLIPTILGVTVDPDKAIIAGTGYDILRDAGISSDIDEGKIEGAQVIVYDEDGNIPDTLTVNYFTDAFPDRDQLWTSADGLWVAANVPPGNLRAEMWGLVDGELRLLGATLLFSEADSINISNIFTGYGDGVKFPDSCLSGAGTTTGGTTTGGTTTGGTTTGGTTTGGTTTGTTTGSPTTP